MKGPGTGLQPPDPAGALQLLHGDARLRHWADPQRPGGSDTPQSDTEWSGAPIVRRMSSCMSL